MPSAMKEAPRKEGSAGYIGRFTTLREGMTDDGNGNSRIYDLQRQLNRLGFTDDERHPLVEDGEFGGYTREVVMNLQRFLRLNGYTDYDGNVPQVKGEYDLVTWQAFSRFTSRVHWSVVEDLKGHIQEMPGLAEQVKGLSDRPLGVGMSDGKLGTEEVTALQEALNAIGFKDDKGNVIPDADGVFGERTAEVVRNVQRMLNTTSFSGNWKTPVIRVDGIFGPETRNALVQFLEDYYNMESGGTAFMER